MQAVFALLIAVAAACLKEGVIILTCGTYGNVIRLLPPLVISDELLLDGLQVLAAGPIVAALTGLGAGAAAGGLTGALIGLGIPEHEAKFFHEELERGGILLGVYTHADRAKIAKEILESAGAEKVRG